MPRGTPDGGYNAFQLAANISDLGEVASRILMGGGSMSKKGRILFATGFEGEPIGSLPPYLWVLNSNPTQPVIVTGRKSANTSYGAAWQGSNSLFVSVAQFQSSSFTKRIPLQISRGGIEVMFSQDALSYRAVEFAIASPAGAAGIVFYGDAGGVVKLYQDNGNYLGSDGASLAPLTLMADVSSYFTPSPLEWHYAKFVMDLPNNQSANAIFDDQYFDLSTFPQGNSTSIVKSVIYMVKYWAFSGTNAGYWFDNLVLTADEP